MKQTLLKIAYRAGLFAPFRLANRNRALIVTYHRFSREEICGATTARAFEAQLEYLSSRYRLVTVAAISRHLRTGGRLPAGLAAITIDDGYMDSYEIAFPILRRHCATATLFVATGFVDGQTWLWTDKLRYLALRSPAPALEATISDCVLSLNLGGRRSRLQAAASVNTLLKAIPDDEKDAIICRVASSLGVTLPRVPPAEFAPLTWRQLREMSEAGIEVGSHTVTHPVLTNVSRERLRLEMRCSRERLETQLGRRIETFCYPNGDYDADVTREAARAGYNSAVTSEYGLNDIRSNPMELRRVHGESDVPHFAQTTSGFERLKERLRRRGRACGARAFEPAST